jgi:ketosteroid isomerase-like protein
MAGESVERLRGMIEDFNAGGIDAALVNIHPELTWHAPPEWLEKSVYVGHEGIRELAASWGQNFEEYRLSVERVVDLGGERALALLHQHGTIKDSGTEVEQAIAYVAEFRDGLVARVDVFFSWEAALEAAGLEQ